MKEWGWGLKEQKRWRIKRLIDNEPAIVGKYGQITRFPDGDLDVWITNVPVARRTERNGWKVKNHYDDGALFIRPFEDLDAAARIIRAPKRRHLSPEQKAKAVERLAKYRKVKQA